MTMKKLITLSLLIMGSISINAQCQIQLSSNAMTLNETQTLSLAEKATCRDAHYWEVSGTGLQVLGNNTDEKLTIQAVSAGNSVIRVNYISPQGPRQCEVRVGVIDPSTGRLIHTTVDVAPSPSQNSAQDNVSRLSVPCTLATKGFKEIRNGETMFSFVPDAEETPETTYTWTALRSDGKEISLTDRTALFDSPKDAYIMRVKLVVQNPICKRELSKVYHQNFLYTLPYPEAVRAIQSQLKN